MAFTSYQFFIFIAVCLGIYYTLPSRKAQYWLLLLSSLFYLASCNLYSLLVASGLTFANYLFARLYTSYAEKESKKKTIVFWSALSLNIAAILAYKTGQITATPQAFLQLFIVVGLGFYSLQLIGWWIDIHIRKQSRSLDPVQFALQTIFFAKLPSGPLLQDDFKLLIPGPHREVKINWQKEDFWYGVQRIMLGIGKKLILADRLQPFVAEIFDEHKVTNGITVYFAPILFTIQLYLDFSAYIDIAIGTSRLFGIRLPENFNFPLRSLSVTQFWRKWHITLVQWLRNNVYFPIGFYFRKHTWSTAFAIGITFVVSAVWHGLAPVFFIWAFFHFIYLVMEYRTGWGKKTSETVKWKRYARYLLTLQLVALAHFFFRAGSLETVGVLWERFINLPFLYNEESSFFTWLVNGGRYIETEFNFRLALVLSGGFLLAERTIFKRATSVSPDWIYIACWLFLFFTFAVLDAGERFLYIQF